MHGTSMRLEEAGRERLREVIREWRELAATPGHEMFESLWLERRRVVTLMLPFDRAGPLAAVAAEMATRSWLARR